MDKIPPPKNPKKKGKGAPPPIENPSANLTKKPPTKNVLMTFSVENQFRREFKGFANEYDMSMVDLLKKCFDSFKTQTQN